VPAIPWRPILERACREAAREVRRGEPVAPLVPRLAADETRHLIPKLLLASETNLLFADGGSGKSLLALALAIAVATGARLPAGLTSSTRGPVLLVDWESCREEHEDRLARLVDGLDVAPEAGSILYRPMCRALADEVAPLRVDIARHQVAFVVVDSFASACGAEPETADSAIRLLNALRTFAPATRLLLAHVTKAAADARGGASRAFGSVFVQNLARNCWDLRRADQDSGSELVMALFHRKMNAGPLYPPLGLRFEFHGPMTSLHAHDIGLAPELVARASLAYRIRAALAGGALTAEQLAEAIDAPETSIAAKLRSLRGKEQVIRLDESRGGRGQPTRWGLAT
jgi:AAA domain